MKVWVLWVNICFLQQRQKSCPSGSAAVCKWCGANNSGLCCSTQSVEYVRRRVWLAQRLCGEFSCCQQSMAGLQSMPISFIGFPLLLCHHMHHHHRYNVTSCGSMAMSARGSRMKYQLPTNSYSDALKSCTDIMNPDFSSSAPWAWHLWFGVKYHNSYWMDCHKIRDRLLSLVSVGWTLMTAEPLKN